MSRKSYEEKNIICGNIIFMYIGPGNIRYMRALVFNSENINFWIWFLNTSFHPSYCGGMRAAYDGLVYVQQYFIKKKKRRFISFFFAPRNLYMALCGRASFVCDSLFCQSPHIFLYVSLSPLNFRIIFFLFNIFLK